ncbi:hypothetical protein [Pseudomonas sp. LF242]
MTYLDAATVCSPAITDPASGEGAYPVDTTDSLVCIIKSYQEDKSTQTVSFRSLVPWMKVGERATHYIHPYPAKLLPQIAHFFLGAKKYFGADLKVLDPFGGTGTVALEAILSGSNAYYSDANPLARLIAKVKTTSLCVASARISLKEILENYKRSRKSTPPDVVNIDKWYTTENIRSLCRLKHAIELSCEGDVRDFFLVTFSAVARKVSLADPRLSVPVRLKTDADNLDLSVPKKPKPTALEVFKQQAESNLLRMGNLKRITAHKSSAFCVGFEARALKEPMTWCLESTQKLKSESIDLIITSPPYAGAQKYIRASSLNLGWLGMTEGCELKLLENLSIGREHLPKTIWNDEIFTGIAAADDILARVRSKNRLRSAIAATYLNEMRQAIIESARVLKPNGHLVLVIGNNEVCGEIFESSFYLKVMANEAGLTTELELVDEIKSRGLMTKRNKTAGIISREWVLLFKKKHSAELERNGQQ